MMAATGCVDICVCVLGISACLAVATSVFLYLLSLRELWRRDFSARCHRSCPTCPSHHGKPHVASQAECKQGIASSAEHYDLSLAKSVISSPHVPEESDKLKQRSAPNRDLTSKPSKERLGDGTAKELNMDHIYVDWLSFFWAQCFVVPSAVFLWATGIASLLVRQALHRRGWLAAKKCVPERVVGRLLLESMELLQYRCKRILPDGTEVASFVWTDLPMLDMSGSLCMAKVFTVDVDLQSKHMVSAALDGRALKASEAMILIWFHTISAGHVKLHALANWGTNLLTEDSFMRRNSIVTAMYNYFGKQTFARLAGLWYRWGLVKYDFRRIEDVFDHGLQGSIPFHGQTRELMEHSEVCSFVVKLRNHFLNTFVRHSADLPGIDGEAMFVGTILHSLDHTLMDWNLEDPLWLDVDSPDFGLMAEVGRVVRVGFVPDLPGLIFEKRYSGAPHKFFQEVYRHAAKINKRLADNMDTCIVK